jgi:hypothetical protein
MPGNSAFNLHPAILLHRRCRLTPRCYWTRAAFLVGCCTTNHEEERSQLSPRTPFSAQRRLPLLGPWTACGFSART